MNSLTVYLSITRWYMQIENLSCSSNCTLSCVIVLCLVVCVRGVHGRVSLCLYIVVNCRVCCHPRHSQQRIHSISTTILGFSRRRFLKFFCSKAWISEIIDGESLNILTIKNFQYSYQKSFEKYIYHIRLILVKNSLAIVTRSCFLTCFFFPRNCRSFSFS